MLQNQQSRLADFVTQRSAYTRCGPVDCFASSSWRWLSEDNGNDLVHVSPSRCWRWSYRAYFGWELSRFKSTEIWYVLRGLVVTISRKAGGVTPTGTASPLDHCRTLSSRLYPFTMQLFRNQITSCKKHDELGSIVFAANVSVMVVHNVCSLIYPQQ